MVKTAILMLAAGDSSRLGRSKQFLEIDGTPLLYSAVREAVVSRVDHVEVVLGYEFKRHATLIDDFFNICVVKNDEWERGFGSSLKHGMENLLQRYPGLEWVMISVCDQPELNSQVYNQLITAAKDERAPILAARYADDKIGTPAVFHKSYFNSLLSDEGIEDFNQLLESLRPISQFIDFPRGYVNIDTMEDYVEYQNYAEAFHF